MNSDLGPTIIGYLEYCSILKKLAHGTVKDIKCTLNKLTQYCSKQNYSKEIWELSLQEYIKWINYCRDNGQTPKHINKNLSHVRGIIDYAWQLEKVDRNVLAKYYLQDASHHKEAEVLTLEEARALIGAFSPTSHEERRKRVIILLLYGCGVRNGELCRLNIQSIDKERREIKVFGKGSKERVIPLMDGLYTELLAYLSDRRSSKGPLFKTLIKKKRIGVTNVSAVVDEAVARVRIDKKITPKTFRHTFASHLADQGVDISVIAKLMGHRSPKETNTYLHAAKNQVKASIFEIKPFSEEESK